MDGTLFPGEPTGKVEKQVCVEWVRDLELNEVLELFASPMGWKKKPLQKITAIHHTIAFLLAKGERQVDISRITGRSTTNINQLQNDPAFQQLVTDYTNMKEVAAMDMLEQLAATGSAALAELQERLETEPEKISDEVLLKIAEKAADRTGFGPSKTVKTVNSADVIRELVNQRETKGKVIDVSAA